jgi:hypothetical protein
MTFYTSTKNDTFSRVFYEKNCLNKITMILMRNILNMKKFLNYFEENIDDRTCRKTLKNTLFHARNVCWQNRLNINFMNYFNHCRFSWNLKKNWTMNFITDLSFNKRSEQIYDFILIIIDRYTKYFRYISIKKNWTTKQFANQLFDEIFSKHEMSKLIMFNKNSLFIFNFWFNFCYHLKIKIRLNIVFHCKTDDQTKKQNQTLKQYLKIYVNYQQNNWIKLLFVAEFAYNNS